MVKQFHFIYKWKTFKDAEILCKGKGLRVYQPYDTLIHKKVHELVETVKFGQYWIRSEWTTSFRYWNDKEPTNLNECIVGGLKNSNDESSPYWSSYKCADEAQVICEDFLNFTDPQPGNF